MSPRWSLKQPGHVDKTAASNVRRVVASASDVHLQELAGLRHPHPHAQDGGEDARCGPNERSDQPCYSGGGSARWRRGAPGERIARPARARVTRKLLADDRTARSIPRPPPRLPGGADGALRFAHVQHRGRAAGAQPWPAPRCRRISCGAAVRGLPLNHGRRNAACAATCGRPRNPAALFNPTGPRRCAQARARRARTSRLWRSRQRARARRLRRALRSPRSFRPQNTTAALLGQPSLM